MIDLIKKALLFPVYYLIWVDNLLTRKKMDMYVVCKKTKEFIPLEAVEVLDVTDKGAVKYVCPFCNKEHTSMIMEKPH